MLCLEDFRDNVAIVLYNGVSFLQFEILFLLPSVDGAKCYELSEHFFGFACEDFTRRELMNSGAIFRVYAFFIHSDFLDFSQRIKHF